MNLSLGLLAAFSTDGVLCGKLTRSGSSAISPDADALFSEKLFLSGYGAGG